MSSLKKNRQYILFDIIPNITHIEVSTYMRKLVEEHNFDEINLCQALYILAINNSDDRNKIMLNHLKGLENAKKNNPNV